MVYFDELGVGYMFEPSPSREPQQTQAWKEFWAYHHQNPQIWDEFIRRIDVLITQGVTKIGADLIFRDMRWFGSVRGSGRFKISNNHYPYYVREYLRQNPHREGFFETRKLTRK